MINVLASILLWINNSILGYFLVLTSIYVLLIIVAADEFVREAARARFAGHDEVFANPLTPAVSVLIAAHDEEPVIVASVRSMLALRYPSFEVVVVDDGSTDGTFAALAAEFDLHEVPLVLGTRLSTAGQVHSVHASAISPVLVVRKECVGRRADALNVGLNVARNPLVCMVDADTLLEDNSLLLVAKPFLDDPDRIVGVGGVVRPINGCRVEAGRVSEVRLDRNWLSRIQVVEYLRAFLLGRTGWSKLGGLLVISGAFGMFRRDVLLDAGGMDHESLGEDVELVMRLHRQSRERQEDYRIAFVSEPVCWTEVPRAWPVLARQRCRWSHGLAQTMWQHRRMMCNPRYGRIGMVALPYYLVFELLGPVVETIGILSVILSFPLGVIDLPSAILFAAVALGSGVVLSLFAIAVETFSFRRYRRWRDIGVLIIAAVLENIGFRQLHAWWRLRGIWRTIRGHHADWGAMTRAGFGETAHSAVTGHGPRGVDAAPAESVLLSADELRRRERHSRGRAAI